MIFIYMCDQKEESRINGTSNGEEEVTSQNEEEDQ